MWGATARHMRNGTIVWMSSIRWNHFVGHLVQRGIDRVAGVVDEDVDLAPFIDDPGRRARSQTPGLVRSPPNTIVSPSIPQAVCWATSASRSLISTFAPCDVNSSAVARPIPRAEPVTIAASLYIEDSHLLLPFGFALRRDLASWAGSCPRRRACFRIRSPEGERPRTVAQRVRVQTRNRSAATDDEPRTLLALAGVAAHSSEAQRPRRSPAGSPALRRRRTRTRQCVSLQELRGDG